MKMAFYEYPLKNSKSAANGLFDSVSLICFQHNSYLDSSQEKRQLVDTKLADNDIRISIYSLLHTKAQFFTKFGLTVTF